MRKTHLFRAIPLAAMAAGLGAVLFLCSVLVEREEGNAYKRTEEQAKHFASQFHTGMLGVVESLQRMGIWWISQGKPLGRDDWNSDAQLFLSDAREMRELSWIGLDGTQVWSYRTGAGLRTKSAQPRTDIQQLVETAQQRQLPAFSNVVDLPDRRPGFYVCVPVQVRHRVRGYLVGLYDATGLIKSLTPSLPDDYHMWISANGRPIYTDSPRESAAAGKKRAVADVPLFNQVWTVSVSLGSGYLGGFRARVLSIAAVFTLLTNLSAALLYHSLRRAGELQRTNAALQEAIQERDIAETRVGELNRDLRRRIADFETLLDVIPIGIAVAQDPECRAIWVNPALARMMGVGRLPNLSKSSPGQDNLAYKLYRHGKEIVAEEFPMQRAAKGIESAGEEYEIVRADGGIVNVLSFASPLVDEHGQVRGVLNACVDITDRKELEQRLRRAQEMKSLGVMAAGIAHDFNNLLTVILGNSELALTLLPAEHESHQLVANAIESSQRAAALVAQLLAYTGRAYHTLAEVDIPELIAEMQPWLLEMAGGRAEIRFQLSRELPRVKADQDQVRQVIGNLVENAVEAMEPGHGVIEISTAVCDLTQSKIDAILADYKIPPGTYVRVEVKDNGFGMAADVAARVFDPFFTTKFLGRGLGLSAAQGIMRAHLGAIRVDSALEAGTSFQLYFPAEAANPLPPEHASNNSGAVGALG